MILMKTSKNDTCYICGAEMIIADSFDTAFFIVECTCCGEAFLLSKSKLETLYASAQ